jgi:signal peptidase II
VVSLVVRARSFFAITALTLFTDLASKAWALRALDHGPLHAIDGRLSFALAHNANGAMGFLRQVPSDTRRAVLAACAILASIALVTIAERTRDALSRFALALTLGGALGNLIDRLLRGAVVDFIDVVYAPGRHWHTFNVADVAIVIGAGLLAVRSMRAPAAPVTTV